MKFLIVQHDPRLGPGGLEVLLVDRRRQLHIVRVWEGEEPPATPDDLRGLVTLGGPAGDALTAACAEAGVPTLAITGSDPDAAAYIPVASTAEAADDALFEAYPEGMPALTLGGVAEGDGVVLARFEDSTPAAIRAGEHAYTLAFHPELDAGHVATLAPDLAEEAARRDVFHRGMGSALLGRWIDEVVGRTEEEAPWGRRGPQPVPAPGLSLHPA